MNINQLVDKFFKEKDLKPATKQHYKYVAKLFVQDMQITEIEDVTREVLLEWRGKVQCRNTQKSTWNNYLRHLLVLLRFAADYMEFDKLPNSTGLFYRIGNVRPKTISMQDIQNILHYLGGNQSSFQPEWFWISVVKTLFYSGIRRQQLAGLTWKDISVEEGTIDLSAKTSKNGNSWVIPIPASLICELEQLKNRTLDVLGEDIELYNRPVFDIGLFNSRYEPNLGLSIDSISGFFKRLSNKTSIRISAHRLRHTFATELSKAGRYKELQNLLGHSSVSMTMKYIHPNVNRIRSLVDTLDDLEL